MTPQQNAPRGLHAGRSAPWVLLAFFAGVVVVFVSLSFAQEVRRRIALQKHIEDLQGEIRAREQRVTDLRELMKYLHSDAYQERAAREKRNVQRPGERVVVVPDGGTVRGTASDLTLGRAAETPGEPSIPQQWWQLLFGSP